LSENQTIDIISLGKCQHTWSQTILNAKNKFVFSENGDFFIEYCEEDNFAG